MPTLSVFFSDNWTLDELRRLPVCNGWIWKLPETSKKAEHLLNIHEVKAVHWTVVLKEIFKDNLVSGNKVCQIYIRFRKCFDVVNIIYFWSTNKQRVVRCWKAFGAVLLKPTQVFLPDWTIETTDFLDRLSETWIQHWLHFCFLIW